MLTAPADDGLGLLLANPLELHELLGGGGIDVELAALNLLLGGRFGGGGRLLGGQGHVADKGLGGQ